MSSTGQCGDFVVQHNDEAGPRGHRSLAASVGETVVAWTRSIVQGNLNPHMVLVGSLSCPHGPLEHGLSHSNEDTDQQVKRPCARSVGFISQGHFVLTIEVLEESSKADDATRRGTSGSQIAPTLLFLTELPSEDGNFQCSTR